MKTRVSGDAQNVCAITIAGTAPKIDTISQSVCPTNHEKLVSRETVESRRQESETFWYQTIIR